MNNTNNHYIKYSNHFRYLSLLYKILGFFYLVSSIIILFLGLRDFLRFQSSSQNDALMIFSIMGVAVLLVFMFSILLLIYARAIKLQKDWAKGIVGYGLGVINLLTFPIGTVVGVYTIWVLIQKEKQT